eukprot:TRINITY_DN111733_c0_g1_i1.p1 TRINITY_DN111733_c0_g1~~TRINITY_DN111733_c0_g1_i1.p1  ORF type:complete len:1027 (-),score=244.31 TRINITY_DN111733_c0_g1_i1:18-3098(-)
MPPEGAETSPVLAVVERLKLCAAALQLGGSHVGEAEQWLQRFQASGTAWQVCVAILEGGPKQDAAGDFLDAFCAQTLATHARALAGRYPRQMHEALSDSLERLLMLHLPARGKPAVWRQLALAVTAARIWLAKWQPADILAAGVLPLEVRWELLTLPTELLFCDRALPLSDVDLWHCAAARLWGACGEIFLHLCGASAVQAAKEAIGKPPLIVLAAWLRAARLSFQWLSGRQRDEAEPIRQLAKCAPALLHLAAESPEDACEVAQQLARWTLCDDAVTPLLSGLLKGIFRASCSRLVLLPLLADLAADRWVRAACCRRHLSSSEGTGAASAGALMVEMARDVANQAALLLSQSVSQSAQADLGSIGEDGEAAFAIWHTFATVLRIGTRGWADEADSAGSHAEWRISADELLQETLPLEFFRMLLAELLRTLRAPRSPTTAALHVLWQVRSSAQSAVAAWAQLMGDIPSWQEQLWLPLREMHAKLNATRTAPQPTEELWQETEAVLWLAFTLAASWPEPSSAPAAAAVVLEVGDILDLAPHPWRALLWSSACSLASTGPPEHASRLVEWMLQRPPQQAACGDVELLSLTELAYAQAVELACRQLPADAAAAGWTSEAARGAVVERIASLALVEVPASMLHETTCQSRARLLSAIRHMGMEAHSLCDALSTRVLPELAAAASAEAAASSGKQWFAAQTLLAVLGAVLPRGAAGSAMDASHPVVVLWRAYWQCFEAALLPQWRPLSAEDQPLACGCDILASAAIRVPVLLPTVLELLVKSIQQDTSPEKQLIALHKILSQVQPPPGQSQHTAQLLARSVFAVAGTLLDARAGDVMRNPEVLCEFYRLAAAALSCFLCDKQLRPLVIAEVPFVAGCLRLVSEALPSHGAAASGRMMRVVCLLLIGDEVNAPAHREVLCKLFPSLCASIARALASQDHMAASEAVADVAEILYRSAEAFQEIFLCALSEGLQAVDLVPAWCRQALHEHVAKRAEWPTRWAWTQQLHHIVEEWQREASHQVLRDRAVALGMA